MHVCDCGGDKCHCHVYVKYKIPESERHKWAVWLKRELLGEPLNNNPGLPGGKPQRSRSEVTWEAAGFFSTSSQRNTHTRLSSEVGCDWFQTFVPDLHYCNFLIKLLSYDSDIWISNVMLSFAGFKRKSFLVGISILESVWTNKSQGHFNATLSSSARKWYYKLWCFVLQNLPSNLWQSLIRSFYPSHRVIILAFLI